MSTKPVSRFGTHGIPYHIYVSKRDGFVIGTAFGTSIYRSCFQPFLHMERIFSVGAGLGGCMFLLNAIMIR
jgi:hypothetical protein